MKLSQLVAVDSDLEITGVSADSRNTKKGDLFLCIRGTRFDGHDYAKEALEKGAVAVVTERRLGLDREILLPDTRRAAASIFASWYGNPQKRLKIVGVTGTNGKTSVVHLLDAIYRRAGYRTATSGTLGTFWQGKAYSAENTTALPDKLYALLREMADDGVEYLFMEVSSHALVLDRVAEIAFLCGIYTNLTPEHMDFHKSMDNYAAAKARLFKQSRYGVFNYDDSYSYIAAQSRLCRSYGYGERNGADFHIESVIKNDLSGIAYQVVFQKQKRTLRSALVGSFNIHNTLAAAAAATLDGVDWDILSEAIASFGGVAGRLEKIYDKEFTIFIDYAHTPDALMRVLDVLRRGAASKSRLRVLFGCGGDRDRSKRPVMGRIAESLADDVIVTSDNARSEKPATIIREILDGMGKHNTANSFRVIEDRKQALEYAIDSAQPGDILLVAGKGHEDYEIDCHGRHPFSEKQILLERLRANRYLL